MKKLMIIVGSVCMIIGLVACGKNDDSSSFHGNLIESSALRVNKDLTEVALTVMREVRGDSETIELQIANNTVHELTFGEPFSIEFYDEREWKVVPFPDDAEFVAIGYTLLPGEMQQMTRNLKWLFPDGLPLAGKYRFRTSVFNNADIPIREYHLYDLAAEFEI